MKRTGIPLTNDNDAGITPFLALTTTTTTMDERRLPVSSANSKAINKGIVTAEKKITDNKVNDDGK
jgi:hypothetical protein